MEGGDSQRDGKGEREERRRQRERDRQGLNIICPLKVLRMIHNAVGRRSQNFGRDEVWGHGSGSLGFYLSGYIRS